MMRMSDHAEDEKAPGKLRIDFGTGSDDNGFEIRVGGRVVDVSEVAGRGGSEMSITTAVFDYESTKVIF